MFNPNAYQDTDFGLESGESFEPEDVEDAGPVDTSRPHIMTVLGPIEPDDLGVCLTREYLFSDLAVLGTDETDYRLGDVERAVGDLESFALLGGRSIVDATTADMGRNAGALLGLAQRVPLHIIASTGRHNMTWRRFRESSDPHVMAMEFVGDLTLGMDGTPALAGMIGIATGAVEHFEADEAVLAAAAEAHLATGAPIAVQLGGASDAYGILDQLEREGVGASSVILQHMDQTVTTDDVISLAARGAWCSFDRIGKAGSDGDRTRARTIVDVFGAGYGGSVLVSQDFGGTSLLSAHGDNPGLTYLLERFTLMLMEAGAEAGMVRRVLIENPRRAICVVPGALQQDR